MYVQYFLEIIFNEKRYLITIIIVIYKCFIKFSQFFAYYKIEYNKSYKTIYFNNILYILELLSHYFLLTNQAFLIFRFKQKVSFLIK